MLNDDEVMAQDGMGTRDIDKVEEEYEPVDPYNERVGFEIRVETYCRGWIGTGLVLWADDHGPNEWNQYLMAMVLDVAKEFKMKFEFDTCIYLTNLITRLAIRHNWQYTLDVPCNFENDVLDYYNQPELRSEVLNEAPLRRW